MQILHTPTLRLGLACCVLACLASSASAQRGGGGGAAPQAISSPIELDRCDGACTVGFSGNSGFEYTIYASGDLINWEPLGFFVETSPGQFAYVDGAADTQAKRYYQIEIHLDPPEPLILPPHLEQLRAELGDETFGEWLESNREQTGNLQGVPEEAVEEMAENNPEAYEQFESAEQALEDFLRDLERASEPQPEVTLPFIPVFNGTYQAMGDEAFAGMLVENQEQWGNYQGICGTGLMEMARLYPDLYVDFLDVELQLEDILGDLVPDLPPGGQELVLPPNLEQLRQQLGDEAFAEWLRQNKQQWGNYQGISEEAVREMERNFPEEHRRFQETERMLEQWLR